MGPMRIYPDLNPMREEKHRDYLNMFRFALDEMLEVYNDEAVILDGCPVKGQYEFREDGMGDGSLNSDFVITIRLLWKKTGSAYTRRILSCEGFNPDIPNAFEDYVRWTVEDLQGIVNRMWCNLLDLYRDEKRDDIPQESMNVPLSTFMEK